MNPTDTPHSAAPAGLKDRVSGFFGDRIQINSVLIVACFAAVLLLESQSAASYPTYFLAISMLVASRQWNDVFQRRMVWLIIALLGYLSLSSLWSDPFEWRSTVSVFSRALLVFFFVVAVAECQLRGQLKRWLARTMAVVGMVAVVAAMAVHFNDPPDHGRLNGLGQLDTQVIAALVYGVCLVFVLDILVTDRSLAWKLLAAVSGLIIAYAVYLSDSRNAWVSVVIGAGTFLLAHRVQTRQSFVVAVLAFVVVLGTLITSLILNEQTQEIMLPRGDSFRPDIWTAIWERISANGFWFGLGINTPDNVFAANREFLHPHNMYLSVMYQGGIVGLVLFLGILVAGLRAVLDNYHHHDAKLVIGILAIALPAYLLDGHELIDKVGTTWFLLWFPVAVGLGLLWSKPQGDLAEHG